MNTKTLKGIGAAASLLIGIGAASPALATGTGAQVLLGAANAIDVWTFSCPAGSAGAAARVLDTSNNAARMQVVLGENSFPTVQVTDFAAGAPPSVFAVVANGPGLYAMAFKKTAAVQDTYRGQAFCLIGGAFNSVGALTRRINQ